MYLSYSGFQSNEKCPYSYWHRYVGKTQPPVMNRVNMLFGTVVGVLFEHFYNEKMWRLPQFVDVLLARVRPTTEKIIEDEVAPGKNGVVDWASKRSNYHSVDEVVADVEIAVQRGIQIIKRHRLVGADAAAEVKLDSKIGGHILGGRCDLTMLRVAPDSDRIIVDGKGSKYRDDYVDKRQLRWYSMLYEARFGSLPDRVGFLYWRSEPEKSIDWFDVSKEDTRVLRETVIEVAETIESRNRSLPIVPSPTKAQVLEAYQARPSLDCKFCDYLTACDAGTRYMENKKNIPPPISDGEPNDAGVGDVGL